MGISDWISLSAALGTIAAVIVALGLHAAQSRSSQREAKKISEIASFRISPSVFTLISQIGSVQRDLQSLDMMVRGEVDVHRRFLELSEYCKAISNASIAALSFFDHKSALKLASGLGKVESLAKMVKMDQESGNWNSSTEKERESMLGQWGRQLTVAYIEVEESTSFVRHLVSDDRDN